MENLPEAFDSYPQQLVLLGIDPRTGRLRRQRNLALAAAAGALAELVIQERVSLEDSWVRVRDERPTEDPILDRMLSKLLEKPGRTPGRILSWAGRTYLDQALAQLEANGRVARVPVTVMEPDRYRILDQECLTRIKAQALAGFTDPAGAGTRAAFLAGMVHELALAPELLPELGMLERGRRAKVLRKRDWVVRTVHAIKQQRAAVMSAAVN